MLNCTLWKGNSKIFSSYMGKYAVLALKITDLKVNTDKMDPSLQYGQKCFAPARHTGKNQSSNLLQIKSIILS